MIHRTAQCSNVEAQGVQKRQLFSYCNLPVEDHAVVIIKRQISTEQSEEQHPHTPHISLGEKHHLRLCIPAGNSAAHAPVNTSTEA